MQKKVPLLMFCCCLCCLCQGYDQYRRASTNGSDMRPLALDLQARGFAVVNLEYRRATSAYTNGVGRIPGTVNDVSEGIDALSCLAELQTLCGFSEQLFLQRVAVVGHSAGGHLGTSSQKKLISIHWEEGRT